MQISRSHDHGKQKGTTFLANLETFLYFVYKWLVLNCSPGQKNCLLQAIS